MTSVSPQHHLKMAYDLHPQGAAFLQKNLILKEVQEAHSFASSIRGCVFHQHEISVLSVGFLFLLLNQQPST